MTGSPKVGRARTPEDPSSESAFLASLGTVRGALQNGPPAGGDLPGTNVAEVPGRKGAPMIAPVQAVAGEVSPPMSAEPGEKLYSTDRGKDPNVRVYRLDTGKGEKPILFTADMDIDADGAGGAWKGDNTGQSQTSLRYGDGESLDPSRLPFIVVPIGFSQEHKGVQLGDYSAVSFNGKTVFGIIGDLGPRGVLGEASIALAASLGIDPDPNRGGTSRSVTYLIFPGSRDSEPPRDPAAIQERGARLLREHSVGLDGASRQ